MTTARATSFATFKDLRNYIKCLLAGGSETACYANGDNGEGAWGDVTAQASVAMVALPVSEMEKKFGKGNSRAARGKLVRVTLAGRVQSFTAEVRDKAPDGVIDLNPGALVAAGLPVDTELSTTATWEWV
jgi:hypothetical protein